jgi:Ner family transcriptional regulator
MSLDKNKMAPAEQDWDRYQIISAVQRAGWSLRRLSIKHGYKPGTLSAALYRPFLRGEEIIAAAIGISPAIIWPSRYRLRSQVRRRTRTAQ